MTEEIANISKLSVQNNDGNARVLKKVTATIIEAKDVQKRKERSPSQSLAEDPFLSLGEQGKIIEPPFDLLALAMLQEQSSEMRPCIEAMEVNIEGFGYRFVSRLNRDLDKIPKDIQENARKERVYLENFFSTATHESFTSFRRKLRNDLESTGNNYFEVIRDMNGKEIQGFTHIPSYQMRLGKLEDDAVESIRPVHQLDIKGGLKIKKIREWRRFRTYAQTRTIRKRNLEILTGSDKIRWFKEFGDTRIYDSRTGEIAKKDIDKKYVANEIVHAKIYSPRTPYGLPRYIGNLLSIYGDRASEEINFVTFQNNNIPSMLIAVSNGQLTSDSITRIKEFVESNIQTSDNWSKFLVLEGEAATEEEGEDGGQVKIDVKPLTKEQHKDALFQNYSKHNANRIRKSWRLPPSAIGFAEDYSRATIESSKVIADEQVFSPERDEDDNVFNRLILPHLGVIYYLFKTNSPNTTDNTQLVKILAGAEKTGGMTPRIARKMLEDILGTELPQFKDDFDPDVPFSLTMAEAVKNQADPTEPGQQVTALKMIKALVGDKINETGDPIIDRLLAIQKGLEDDWSEGMEEEEDEEHEHDDEE